METLLCNFIGSDPKAESCSKPAVWVIHDQGTGPELQMHACDEHLPKLIRVDHVAEVWHIDMGL